MSRRCHHGSPRHARVIGHDHRRGPTLVDRAAPPLAAIPTERGPVDETSIQPDDARAELIMGAAADLTPSHPSADVATGLEVVADLETGTVAEVAVAEVAVTRVAVPRAGVAQVAPDRRRAEPLSDRRSPPSAPRPGGHASAARLEPDLIGHGATAPQLRRFIKSRAYVPMHELRRRFAINGDDDDVTPLEVDRQRVYVGLPEREGRLLGELLNGGDIGVELSLDPIAPIVVGVFPMRPIPRT